MEMAYLLSTSLNLINVGSFADGKTSIKIKNTVHGKEVYVICSTMLMNSILELLLTISMLRRGSVKCTFTMIPYYRYSMQDQCTSLKREPIAIADMVRLLEEMGVDSIICCNLHNPPVKGFFQPTVPVDHLMPEPVAAAYFYKELFGTGEDDDRDEKKGSPTVETLTKITIVAAHENQVFRANAFYSAPTIKKNFLCWRGFIAPLSLILATP
jgi:phosphoribosylpyrophosphate synthetase